MKKCIINGDDFGITRACNYAIIDCFQDGLLTSTSMMTNMPAAEHAARLMEKYPDLSVGIHLNLTVGKPLSSDVPSLLKEDGTFNKGILKNAESVNLDEVRKELKAQVDRFIALTGKVPDHFNSHHGIEAIPGAAQIQIELANQYDRPIRHFLFDADTNGLESKYEIAAPVFVFKEDWSEPVTVRELTDVIDQMPGDDDLIIEIAGHPGYVDTQLMALSSLTTGRCYDAQNFLSEELGRYLKEHNFTPATYLDLKKRSER